MVGMVYWYRHGDVDWRLEIEMQILVGVSIWFWLILVCMWRLKELRSRAGRL